MLHLNCLQALNRQGTCTKHVRCNSLIPPPCIGIKTLPAQTQCIRCPPCPPTQRRPKRALVCVGSSKNVDASDNSHDHNNQHANRDIKAAHSEFTLKRRSVGRPALSVSSSTTGPDGKGFAPVSRPGPGVPLRHHMHVRPPHHSQLGHVGNLDAGTPPLALAGARSAQQGGSPRRVLFARLLGHQRCPSSGQRVPGAHHHDFGTGFFSFAVRCFFEIRALSFGVGRAPPHRGRRGGCVLRGQLLHLVWVCCGSCGKPGVPVSQHVLEKIHGGELNGLF
mmetsp:Transcript_29855/g.56281  ORF Transcript_29855/g.56281 Transcript_29855/m.56281 type:complete len:278 (-) Transcript_29855:388-1221(-)